MVSGHTTEISNEYMKLEHLEEKESTGKWFGILLLPAVILIVGLVMLAGAGLTGAPGATLGGAFGFVIGMIVAPIAALYLLYKISTSISGHEKKYGDYTRVDHMDKKESTVKWMMFGLTGALTIYYVWKASEMISGHEVVRG